MYNFNYSHAKSSILIFIPKVGLLIEHVIFNKDLINTFDVDEDTPANLYKIWMHTLEDLLDREKIETMLDIHGVGFKSIEDVKAFREYFNRL